MSDARWERLWVPWIVTFFATNGMVATLENGAIGLKSRESERKVSRQQLLFVANVHISFPRFGEAVAEQCSAQARRGGITCDIVRRKGAEAIDDRRDRRLPTGRIVGIKPTIDDFSKLDGSVRRDLQEREADHFVGDV